MCIISYYHEIYCLCSKFLYPIWRYNQSTKYAWVPSLCIIWRNTLAYKHNTYLFSRTFLYTTETPFRPRPRPFFRPLPRCHWSRLRLLVLCVIIVVLNAYLEIISNTNSIPSVETLLNLGKYEIFLQEILQA